MTSPRRTIWVLSFQTFAVQIGFDVCIPGDERLGAHSRLRELLLDST